MRNAFWWVISGYHFCSMNFSCWAFQAAVAKTPALQALAKQQGKVDITGKEIGVPEVSTAFELVSTPTIIPGKVLLVCLYCNHFTGINCANKNWRNLMLFTNCIAEMKTTFLGELWSFKLSLITFFFFEECGIFNKHDWELSKHGRNKAVEMVVRIVPWGSRTCRTLKNTERKCSIVLWFMVSALFVLAFEFFRCQDVAPTLAYGSALKYCSSGGLFFFSCSYELYIILSCK